MLLKYHPELRGDSDFREYINSQEWMSIILSFFEFCFLSSIKDQVFLRIRNVSSNDIWFLSRLLEGQQKCK